MEYLGYLVLPMLLAAVEICIRDRLSGQEADLWKDRTLNWYAQQPEKHLPLRYIGVVTVREFMGRAAIWTGGFIRKYASL